MTGKVKFFLEDKGYGFIIAEEKEYFVHHKNILQEGHKKLHTGDIVDFDLGLFDNKECAINISLLQKAAK